MNKPISPQKIQDVRMRTGVGLYKCKEALQEAGGDVKQAIHILRKKGIASAVKKRGRETNEGLIEYVQDDQGTVLVEVNAETDFVVQTARFKEFVKNICMQALQSHTQSIEELLKQKYYEQPSLTIDEYCAEIIQIFGENIQIKRILHLAQKAGQSLGVYSHMGGKIVAAVILQGGDDFATLAREVAMHVVAEAPDFLSPKDVSQYVILQEEDIIRNQVKNKPPEVMDKIIQGKMQAFYEQACLLKQKFVKEPSISVKDFVTGEGKKMGKELEILYFVRWQIGE